MAVDCLNEFLEASEVDGSFPMPSTITQVWVPSRADIKKLVKLRYYQAHNKFIPMARASVLDPVANRLGMSLMGSYPVKISAIKELEILSRDIIRLLCLPPARVGRHIVFPLASVCVSVRHKIMSAL